MRSGEIISTASIGCSDEMSPSAKLRTALLPSPRAKAPVPPAGNSTKRKSRSRPGFGPATVVMFEAPFRSPTRRSGIALPRVPTTSDSRARRTSPMAPQAAGGRAFTTVPSGAVTRIGRSAPALIGPVGSRSDFVIVNVAVVAGAGPRFAGPRTWGAQPVKVALDDHVGVRGADDHGAHLAHDRREPPLDQLDGDGVEPARLDAGGPVGRAGGNRLVHASRTSAKPAAATAFSPATSRQARRKTSASAL